LPQFLVLVFDASGAKTVEMVVQGSAEIERRYIDEICADIAETSILVLPTSKVKDESRVLGKPLGELSSELLEFCSETSVPGLRLRPASRYRRRLVREYLEDVSNVLCSSMKAMANRLARDVGLDDFCDNRSDEGVLRRLVDSDLHIVFAALRHACGCSRVRVYTSDRGLYDRLRTIAEVAEDQCAHAVKLEPKYVPRPGGGV